MKDEANILESQGKISIIMPVYNVAPYLAETLQSIQHQTYTRWECICVDDGSTDGSADIVREFMQKDARIRLVTQPNQGPGAARNNGIKHARGEFIAMLDADDRIAPDMVQKCLERLQEDDSDICIFGHRTFCGQEMGDAEYFGMPVTEEGGHACFSPAELGDDLFFCTTTHAWNRMCRASVIKRNNLHFLPLKHWEEVPYCLLTLSLARHISFVRMPLYHYRTGRSGSLTSFGKVTEPEIATGYGYAWMQLKEHGLLLQYGLPFILRFMRATHDFFRRDISLSLLRRSRRVLDDMFASQTAELEAAGVDLGGSAACKLRKARARYKKYALMKFGEICLGPLGLGRAARVLYRGCKALLKRRRSGVTPK